MLRELIIGHIPADFDPQKHIPITPLCFYGKEDIYPDFANLQFLDPFSDPNDIKWYDRLVMQESLCLTDRFAAKYNPCTFHNHSFRFWKTIYYPSLSFAITLVRKHCLLIEAAINQYQHESIKVKIIREPIFKFCTIFDLVNNLNITFQEKLLSAIIDIIKPSKWVIEYIDENDSENKVEVGRGDGVEKRMPSVRNVYKRLFYRSKLGYGINLIDNALIHLLLYFKHPSTKNDNEGGKINHLLKIDLKEEFIDIIDNLLSDDLKQINKVIKEQRRKRFKRGKVSLFSNALFFSLEDKVAAAFCYDEGEKVVAAQHGGHNYGSALTFEFNEGVEYSASKFISWGWDKIDGFKRDNILPLPSPLLSKKFNKYSNANSKIILVGTVMPIIMPRFDANLSINSSIEYRGEKLSFLKMIFESRFKEDLYYKPYSDWAFALQDKKYYSNYFPDLKFIEGDLHSEILKCRLLILDHPGTTWNIAMAANVPLILFWKPHFFYFNDEAQRWLGKFKEIGIYHENANSAVSFVVNKFENILEWWSSNEVQSLRKLWMMQYARVSNNWFKDWVEALSSI